MRTYIIIAILLHVFYIQAQNINISVAMPSDCNIENDTKSILMNKLRSITSNYGVSGTECSAIVVVPDVEVISTNMIHGGMRKIISVELCVTLTVKNVITKTVFNTLQLNLMGEGYSEFEAYRSAINKMIGKSEVYAKFINVTQKRICDYYAVNTSAILDRANALAGQQRYEEALAFLATYPETLPGYVDVANGITSIFNKCQTHQCSQILLSAQTAYAQQDYILAADLIALIDAKSSCVDDAKKLLHSIKNDMDKQYDDSIELERETIRSNERIEMAKSTAIADIISAYLQQQTDYIFLF